MTNVSHVAARVQSNAGLFLHGQTEFVDGNGRMKKRRVEIARGKEQNEGYVRGHRLCGRPLRESDGQASGDTVGGVDGYQRCLGFLGESGVVVGRPDEAAETAEEWVACRLRVRGFEASSEVRWNGVAIRHIYRDSIVCAKLMKLESALVHNLSRFRWQLFGTLTLRSDRIPRSVLFGMVMILFRRVACWYRVRPNRLGFVIRFERGEVGGRLHLHFVLCGLPRDVNVDRCAWSIERTWENLGGGMARVRVFTPSDSAVEYLLKSLHLEPMNAYESGKFAKVIVEDVIVSKSIQLGTVVADVPSV